MIIIVDFIKELLIVPYTPSSEKMSEPTSIVLYTYFWCCNNTNCAQNKVILELVDEPDKISLILKEPNKKYIDVSKYTGSNIYIVIGANPDDNGDCELEFSISKDEDLAKLYFCLNDAKVKSNEKFKIP